MSSSATFQLKAEVPPVCFISGETIVCNGGAVWEIFSNGVKVLELSKPQVVPPPPGQITIHRKL